MSDIKFWKKKIKLLIWDKYPKKTLSKNKKNLWFDDGQLNVAKNCLRNNKNKKKIALICYNKNLENQKFSYEYLDLLVNEFCVELLKLQKKRKKKIKRVLIHSSASIESAVSMLSCAKLGIFQSVIFEDLNKEAIETRIKLFKPDLIISRDIYSNIKKKFKKYLLKKLPFFIFTKNEKNEKNIFSINLKLLLKKKSKFINFKPVKSNSFFFSLFTSGSTGEPKGIIHSFGGYLMYAKYTCKNFLGIKNKSVILTASDAAWINGHTYSLYGPLSIGATTILLENPNLLLNFNFLKKILLDHKVNVLYLPVTLIRMMKAIFGKKKIKENSIQTIGSMGEPLAPKVGHWFANFINKKNNSIVNTYFQTETGGILSAPKYNSNCKINPHGSVGFINKKVGMFISKQSNKLGEILVKYPWPGCMINVLNSNFVWNKYWNENGYFKMFDTGKIENKNLFILGRNDDVINIRGHRIGSGEIESIILKIDLIHEACAIDIPSDLEGNQLILILTAKKTKNLINKVNHQIVNFFGNYALPKKIYFVNNLPKTKSGKILRRVIRKILINNGKNIGDISTINDKQNLDKIKKLIIHDPIN